jgi:hypothetical protein
MNFDYMKMRVISMHLLGSTSQDLAVCLMRLDYRFDSELRLGWFLERIDQRILNRRNQFEMNQRHPEPSQ